MLKLLKKTIFYITTSCLLLLSLSTFGYGQQISVLDKTIRIGELKGRTDIRNLKIPTTQGLIPIKGEGNFKPFSIVSLSPNQLTLKFYRKENFDPRTPQYLTIKFYETERALITGLILDEIDIAVLESERSATEVKKSNSHFSPLPIPMEANKVKLVVYNHKNEFLKNKEIRKAISYGIKHKYIIQKIILGGKATIARGPFDENSKSYNSGMPSYKYDPRLALQKLRKEGWHDNNRNGILEKNGKALKIDLFYQKGLRLDEQISRIIKINLIKLGIDVRPRPLEKRILNDKMASGNFDAILTDHTFEDGLASLESFFSVGGDKNYSGYKNSTLEKYIGFYKNAKKSSQRSTLLQSIQNVINGDQPATFLYFKWWTHYLVNVEKIGNFRYTEGPNSGKVRPFDEWHLNKK